MTAEEAGSLIIAPYVTEKTFNQIEKENKLAFIVAEKASKKKIIEAIRILYESEVDRVNTTRTI
ncbi:MAG: 50S ribosomal protein L23, partial [Nitrososphaera sp.]